MDPIVLFHTHGLGEFDFSDLSPAELELVNELAKNRNVKICPTVYLTKANIVSFDHLIKRYAVLKAQGKLPHILGFSIEGPVLGSKGGTPTGSVWSPSPQTWKKISEWFEIGLKYIVISPDKLALTEEIGPSFSFADLLLLIYSSGGRIALGHFEGIDPELSVTRLHEVLSLLEEHFQPSEYLVLTDHLFNDMPRSFMHAFRTPQERKQRKQELKKHDENPWTSKNLSDLLGPVPAAMLIAAKDGRLTPALNFDGGHVDLEICRLTMKYLGSRKLIAMTDHSERHTLAGEKLYLNDQTRLLYRDDGVLAASSVPHENQIRNMKSIGLSDDDILDVFTLNPLKALNYRPAPK